MEERNLWVLSAGDKRRANGKNVTPVHLFSTMDELALGAEQPLIIETQNLTVLHKAAEYAAQKGYDLVSPDPAQNLEIMARQNALAGEEIAEGELGPSKQKMVAVDLPEVEPAAKTTQKAVETDDLADFSKIEKDTQSLPDPFSNTESTKGPTKGPTKLDFPAKNPPEVLAKRFGIARAKDHGNRIVITRMGMLAVTPPQRRARHELVTAALLKSRERFGDLVRVEGNKAFEKAVIHAAIEQGIPLEMGSERGEKLYALALQGEEKRLARMKGQLSQSQSQQVEAQGKEKGKNGREIGF